MNNTPQWGWREWLAVLTALLSIMLGLGSAVSLAREEGRVTRAMLESGLNALRAEVASVREVVQIYVEQQSKHDKHQDEEIGIIRQRQDDVRERLRAIEQGAK